MWLSRLAMRTVSDVAATTGILYRTWYRIMVLRSVAAGPSPTPASYRSESSRGRGRNIGTLKERTRFAARRGSPSFSRPPVSLNVTLSHSCRTLPHPGHLQGPVCGLLCQRAARESCERPGMGDLGRSSFAPTRSHEIYSACYRLTLGCVTFS
jgi:hypothetical protein